MVLTESSVNMTGMEVSAVDAEAKAARLAPVSATGRSLLSAMDGVVALVRRFNSWRNVRWARKFACIAS